MATFTLSSARQLKKHWDCWHSLDRNLTDNGRIACTECNTESSHAATCFLGRVKSQFETYLGADPTIAVAPKVVG